MRNFPRNPDVELFFNERAGDAGPYARRVIHNTQHQRLVRCGCGKALRDVRRTFASRINEVHMCAECFDRQHTHMSCVCTDREVNNNPIFEEARVTLTYSCGNAYSGFGVTVEGAEFEAFAKHVEAGPR